MKKGCRFNMAQTVQFKQDNRQHWDLITSTLNRQVFAAKKDYKGDFEVEIRALKKAKSYKQLKGLYRLFGILLPHFKEWTGEYWDSEKIKELIKKRYGYTSKFKGVEICKSLKDATMNDLIGIIKETEVFAAEMGVENCYLQSQEMTELLEYYK